MSYAMRVPLFPLFAELKDTRNFGGIYQYVPNVIFFYFATVAWVVDRFGPFGRQIRHVADHIMIVSMWVLLIKATRYSDVEVIRGIDGRVKNAVFYAAIPCILGRFITVPQSSSNDIIDVLTFLFFGYALHCLICFLIACQADERGNEYLATWRTLFYGLIPFTSWRSLSSYERVRKMN